MVEALNETRRVILYIWRLQRTVTATFRGVTDHDKSLDTTHHDYKLVDDSELPIFSGISTSLSFVFTESPFCVPLNLPMIGLVKNSKSLLMVMSIPGDARCNCARTQENQLEFCLCQLPVNACIWDHRLNAVEAETGQLVACIPLFSPTYQAQRCLLKAPYTQKRTVLPGDFSWVSWKVRYLTDRRFSTELPSR